MIYQTYRSFFLAILIITTSSSIFNNILQTITNQLNIPEIKINDTVPSDIINTVCDSTRLPNITQDILQPLSFDQFIQLYEIVLENSNQFTRRCFQYYENVKTLQSEINVNNRSLVQLGITSLMSLLPDQIQGLRIQQYKDFKLYEQKIQPITVQLDLPESINWKEQNVLSPVKDTRQCTAISSFVVVAYVQAKIRIRYGIKYYPNYYSYDLSERYIIECGNGVDSCDGGYLEQVLQFASKGIPYEYDLPQGNIEPEDCQQVYLVKWIGDKAQCYQNVTDQQLMTLLVEGPVIVTLRAQQLLGYKSGILECANDQLVNTASLLVGYTKDFWLIQHSWGQQWGEQGFIRIKKDHQHTCGLGTKACILTKKTYKNPFEGLGQRLVQGAFQQVRKIV